MFIRFVINNYDPDSGKRQGLFQAMSDLESAGKLLPYEQQIYDEIYDWFRHNLKKPRSLSKSAKPHAKNVAISWFKDTAKEHIDKIRSLVTILNSHGIVTDMIRSERPGYVVYEDEYQVAAEPFKETGT
jgi:hypothetical protein